MSLYTPFLGSVAAAVSLALFSRQQLVGYTDFLSKFPEWDDDFFSLPVTTKDNYMLAYPPSFITPDNFRDSFGFIRSSGFSGKPSYWPQSKQAFDHFESIVRYQLESVYKVHTIKTMAIVALPLDSWIRGETLSFLLKTFAGNVQYPFLVFSSGDHFDEIIDIVKTFEGHYDQFLIYISPADIPSLSLKAKERGIEMPLSKLRFCVMGEPFSESLRVTLQKEHGVPLHPTFMLSLYGNSDFGILGFESPASALLRSVLHIHPHLALKMGLNNEQLPQFFHCSDPALFLEDNPTGLLITAEKTIPLIRYNLKDKVKLMYWNTLRNFLLSHADFNEKVPELLVMVHQLGPYFGDILLYFGRATPALRQYILPFDVSSHETDQ
jgi:phenylacetate-coenzyme A ligase PaaK-like adenylate-forming protein